MFFKLEAIKATVLPLKPLIDTSLCILNKFRMRVKYPVWYTSHKYLLSKMYIKSNDFLKTPVHNKQNKTIKVYREQIFIHHTKPESNVKNKIPQ